MGVDNLCIACVELFSFEGKVERNMKFEIWNLKLNQFNSVSICVIRVLIIQILAKCRTMQAQNDKKSTIKHQKLMDYLRIFYFATLRYSQVLSVALFVIAYATIAYTFLADYK